MNNHLFLIFIFMSVDYPFSIASLVIYSKLFRFCDLGSSLSDVLKEMVDEKKLSEKQMESILKCYDKVHIRRGNKNKEICLELERQQNELPKAHISV